MSSIIHSNSLGGAVSAPASKSYAHRLYICAALSKEAAQIACGNKCYDIMSTVGCLRALGAGFNGNTVTPVDRSSLPHSAVLDCGSCGSTLRFLMPIVAALGCGAHFKVSEELSRRPIEELIAELVRNGAVFEDSSLMPSKLLSSSFEISGDVSSQFISGLLMALPILGGGIVNITTELKSSKYVDITIDCLRNSNIYVNRIGNRIEVCGEYDLRGTHTVEGDWSAAAFWLCAGAIGKQAITVNGLNPASLQGDRRIVDILIAFGAEVSMNGGSVTAYPSRLKSIDIDASEIPDLIPVLSVICAAAEGESRIFNAEHLRYKESDRLYAIKVMLTSLGADVTELPNGLIIRGGKKLQGGKVSCFNDHRIAMSTAVASLICDGDVCVDDLSCVGKSYPDFIRDFVSLGGEIYEQI